ncbi:hypothetical protein AVEN_186690-1 [Araneus ventricosus]|uniref:Uncharacterized protein n=1 Tax=Araneus ventricosus TaxID=182803 RepID=A0A4Y2GAB1_ARAVE|nr:hypothetical protein AVEN_186690-1 [Araneus ventricosus]
MGNFERVPEPVEPPYKYFKPLPKKHSERRRLEARKYSEVGTSHMQASFLPSQRTCSSTDSRTLLGYGFPNGLLDSYRKICRTKKEPLRRTISTRQRSANILEN